ncbi:MAG: hypothetical protein L0229_17155 [Blastocatellia bacterium]|nr:hypothetical protein [Blastocatellia bacterium]
MILDISSWIVDSLFGAVVHGGRRVRLLFSLAAITIALAIISLILAENIPEQKRLLNIIGGILGVIGAILILSIAGYQRALVATERQKIINKVEERVREHPNEPQAAWELARIKLESYLNRNLMQIRWIFFLTLLVITVGFVIIGYGTVQVYKSPENFQPSIVVTLSGVIVEFIAATFLLIYKSTMEQARDYVNILERINAVGMSVQILDSIESDDTGLRDKTRADIASGLLTLYGSVKNK